MAGMTPCMHHEAFKEGMDTIKGCQENQKKQISDLYEKVNCRPTTGVLLTIAGILCVVVAGLFGAIWMQANSNNKDLQAISIQTAQIATALDIKIKIKTP